MASDTNYASSMDIHLSKQSAALSSAYMKDGLKGLSEAINKDLIAWKEININIAITGSSGSGKSSFINAIRGLDGDSPGAALTGPIETTQHPTDYRHPDNERLLLTDLPGIGTDNYPKETYIQDIGFEKFDFLFIASEKVFSENDIWLAQEIEKLGKKFYFIRTKFASELVNEKKRKRLNREFTLSEENERKKTLKTELEKHLKDTTCKDNIFIIDNFQRSKFDFPDLEQRLKCDTIKREAMVLTLQALTEQAIIEKKKVLEERIWKAALRAAFAPRAYDIDFAILKNEKDFYIEQFNLDIRSLKHDGHMAKMSDYEIFELLQNSDIENDAEKQKTYENEFKKLVPFLPIGNQVKTYRLGKEFLQDSLKRIVERAIEVNYKFTPGYVN